MSATISGDVKTDDLPGLRPRFDFGAGVPIRNGPTDFKASRRSSAETIELVDAAPLKEGSSTLNDGPALVDGRMSTLPRCWLVKCQKKAGPKFPTKSGPKYPTSTFFQYGRV